MNWLNIVIYTGKWLRKYAVLTIILSTLTFELSSTLLYGMSPRPQLPPNGYIAERGLVTLQWNKGDIEEPITLQISTTKDFEELIYDKKVTGITFNFKENLLRGQTYYWRLIQAEQPGIVSNFKISDQHVKL